MNTKILNPNVKDNIIDRLRLIDTLHSNLSLRAQVVWSPAGYGKTTLISQFANDLEIPVCWYTMDESDSLVPTLLDGLVASIRDRFSPFGNDIDIKLGSAANTHSETALLARKLAHSISSDIQEYFVLILDNFHAIADGHSSVQFINTLMENIPENCHLVIISRNPVNLPAMAKLFTKNQIAFLNDSSLLFTAEDTKKLVKKQFNLDISQEEAEKLVNTNNGWVTGIILQALNAGGQENTKYPGNDKVVEKKDSYSYLANEFLASQSEDFQDFLLETSLLDELDPDICDSYRNSTVSRLLLGTSEQQNLFIQKYPLKDDHYQYHPQFRELLRDKLRRDHPKKYTNCHKQLAKLFYSKQRWEDAVCHFICAGDHKKAVTIIKENKEQLLSAGKWLLVDKWVKQLPEENIFNEPEILLLYAQSQIHLGNIEKAYIYANHILKKYRTKKYILFRGRALSIRSAVFRLNGHYEESKKDLISAIQILKNHRDQYRILGDIYRRLGNTLIEQGQLNEAVTILQKSLKNYTSDLELSGMAETNNSLGILYKRMGDLCRAKVHFENARGIWQKLGNDSALTQVINNVGTILQRQGQYDSAIQMLEEGREKAKLSGYLRMQACIVINLAEVFGDIGNYTNALDLYKEGAELSEKVMEPYYIAWTKAGMAEIYRQIGDYNKAETLIGEAILQVSDNNQQHEVNLFSIIKARIRRDQGFTKESSSMLSKIEAYIKKIGDKETLARIYLNRAQISFITRDFKNAILWLNKTSRVVKQQLDYYSFLAVEAKNDVPLLQYGVSKQIGDGLFDRILEKVQAISSRIPEHDEQDIALFENKGPKFDLEVYALGEASVKTNSTISNVEWRSNRAKEIFFYLLVHPDGKTKEQIIAALWPDLPPGKANGNFHVNLYRARKAIFPGIFTIENNLYRINPNLKIWFDVVVFQDNLRVLREGRKENSLVDSLMQNIQLYKGNFLEGFYGEWVEEYRREIEDGYLKTLSQLAKRYTNEGQFDHAIAILEKYSTVDPYNDDIYVKLIELYLNKGDRNFARRIYKRYSSIMKDDLQADIPPNIKDLFDSPGTYN